MSRKTNVPKVGQKLTNAPLVYSLCQVAFSDIVSMKNFVPQIHEAIRDRYPLYQEQRLRTVTLDDSNAPQSADQTRWLFTSKSQRTGFILNTNSLSLQTTEYNQFPHFAEDMAYGLQAFSTIETLPLITRIGLRYVDYIVPTEGKSLSDYVKTELQGAPLPDEMDTTGCQSLTSASTKYGTLLIRFTGGTLQSPFPMDLQPISLRSPISADPESVTGILDIDHAWFDEPFDFSSDEALASLKNLHDNGTRVAFRHSVTEEALVEWQ